ncbi:uncharacterized protein E0L32_008481 [Thyridium curvatum]|uniref:Arb2 domain-containing protein n=1 Tax=Thyridium curvatum TaxID=1093900 RepID=A0A507AJR4_9PEZI|nr:uncharacterized protein E0L32_008481 [Thyridium curvatum]TPX10595.1 hypothetical protein E0L32_008481 [Thyridium curvatum]
MFRRRFSGLPPDPYFPPDLKELGYFINEQDEIRNSKDPRFYFKYFLTKNERWNDRQRFAMNEAVEVIVHDRLKELGLAKIRLPLGAGPKDRHVPIFVSPDLTTASRVVLIVGESEQELGVLAHRVIGGKGGIDAGSLVSAVRRLRSSPPSSSPDDDDDEDGDDQQQQQQQQPPAVVLANTGQLFWWPEGGRALNPPTRHQVPRKSAVHYGLRYDPAAHAVPGHEDRLAHVRSLFRDVLAGMKQGAVLDVVGLGDGADAVTEFLNCEQSWRDWGARLGCLAVVAGFYDVAQVKVEGLKTFLKERARAYICCEQPVGTPISAAAGNPLTVRFTDFGCPVYASGELYYTETAFVSARDLVLDFLDEAARDPEGFRNPEMCVEYTDPGREQQDGDYDASSGWGEAEWNNKPEVTFARPNDENKKPVASAAEGSGTTEDPAFEKVVGGKSGAFGVEPVEGGAGMLKEQDAPPRGPEGIRSEAFI